MDDLTTFYESKGDVTLWPQNVDDKVSGVISFNTWVVPVWECVCVCVGGLREIDNFLCRQTY